jgi:hypothetical protein
MKGKRVVMVEGVDAYVNPDHVVAVIQNLDNKTGTAIPGRSVIGLLGATSLVVKGKPSDVAAQIWADLVSES